MMREIHTIYSLLAQALSSCKSDCKVMATSKETFCAMSEILACTVKDIRNINKFMDNMWLTFCKNWNPQPLATNVPVTRKPNRYNCHFLGQFIMHAATYYNDSETYKEYDEPPAKKQRMTPLYQQMTFLGKTVDKIWICVGQAGDEGMQRVKSKYGEVAAALPFPSIVHAGSAVAMFLHSLDCGLFSARLGCHLPQSVELNCLHLESKFEAYPTENEGGYFDAIQKMESTLQAFVVRLDVDLIG